MPNIIRNKLFGKLFYPAFLVSLAMFILIAVTSEADSVDPGSPKGILLAVCTIFTPLLWSAYRSRQRYEEDEKWIMFIEAYFNEGKTNA